MTARITTDDLFKFAAGHHPEPFAPVTGQSHHYRLIASLVNQLAAHAEMRRDANSSGRINDLHAVEGGIMVALGEVLSDRAWANRDGTHDDDQWIEVVVFRAAGYLEWLKPLLEPKREETQWGH